MGKEKILCVSILLILLIVIFNGFNYKDVEQEYVVDNFPEYELANLSDARYNFKEGQGIIQITCKNLVGDGKKRGGVYVSVNGTIKLNITTTEPRNLKIKVSDLIIVKGHNLNSNATVTISDAVGLIDTNIKGELIEVGNLAKYFTTIKAEALD